MRIAQPSEILGYLPLYALGHDIVTYDRPRNAIEAVVKSQADLCIGDPFLFDYYDYDKNDIVIIAGFSNRIFHSLITFDPFLDSKNLKGRTIVSYPEPSTSFFLSRNLKKEKKLGAMIQTPFNTELGPLLTQEADMAIVLEPNLTYALKNGAREIMDFSKKKAVMTGIMTTRHNYEKNRKEIEIFLADIRESIKKICSDEEYAYGIAKKNFPMVEEEVLRQ